MKGNLTVEAAFVFPFCFAVIGVICYLGVYSYHLAMLKLTACECITQTLEKRDLDDQSFEKELTKLLTEKTKERSVALKDIRVSVKVGKIYITAELQAVQQMIFSQSVQTDVTYQKTCPEKVLRAVAAGRGKD